MRIETQKLQEKNLAEAMTYVATMKVIRHYNQQCFRIGPFIHDMLYLLKGTRLIIKPFSLNTFATYSCLH